MIVANWDAEVLAQLKFAGVNSCVSAHHNLAKGHINFYG